MDMGGKDDDGVNFNSSNMSCSWQLSSANLANASMGMVPNCNPGLDSFCSAIWDQPNSANVGFGDANLHANVSSSSLLGAGTIDFEPSRSGANGNFGVVWNPPNGMFKGSLLPPTVPGVLPQFLPQFQVDSGFIERAARFSCFSGGNMGDVMNPFNTLECMNAHSKPQEVSVGNGLKSEPVTQSQKHQITSLQAQSYKKESLPIGHTFTQGSSLEKDKKNESIIRSREGAKECAGVSEIESDGLECSDRCGQELSESAVGQSSAKGLGSKKRKRSGQGAELDQNKGTPSQPVEAANDQTEIQQKGDQNAASTASRPGGENDKQGSQTSDPPKEEYIHIRARRGQATNSHSLAERVRREKISERMKFLQDLVPGCNKVIGKAVMLDEIINYVQSLQRQIEFLSMKLATINPRLDFNPDVVFPKDISRAGSSSSLAFPPDMAIPYPPIHPPQPMLIQGGLPGLKNSTAALHRTINSQLPNTSETNKDPTSQVVNAWNDELHNVFQMGFNSTAPLSSQYASSQPPDDHMKTEP